MKVKTRMGEMEVPEPGQIGPRTKYWVEALTDLVRLEELQGVVAKMLMESYEIGRVQGIMAGFDKRTQNEVIDVEWREVESEEPSAVEVRSESLGQQGELASTEELGEEVSQVGPGRPFPESQADGFAR